MGKFCRSILVVLLSGFMTNSFSQVYEIDIEEFNRTEMEFIFDIVDKDYEDIRLDCQGFINMVSIEHYSGKKENLVLDISECEDILFKVYHNVQDNIPTCLITDLNKRKYKVMNDYCVK